MPQNTSVGTRFFSAFGLTFRFAGYCLGLHIGLFILVMVIFHLKNENAVLVAAMYFAVFFTVAFLEHGRESPAMRVVAALAGLGASGAVGYYAASEDDDDSSQHTTYVNPTTGLPMVGGVDVGGNAYGASMFTSSSDEDWSSSTSSDTSNDFHHSVNTNGLPMINDSIDVHGNAYGTNSMDDMFNSSTSMFDDSSSTSMFDDSSSTSMFNND